MKEKQCPQCKGSGKVPDSTRPYFYHGLADRPFIDVFDYINNLYVNEDFRAELVTIIKIESNWFIIFKNLDYFA